MESTESLKALVACRDANGAPTFYVATLHATEGEQEKGLHYPVARRQAQMNGYEVNDGTPVIDRRDAAHSQIEKEFDLVASGLAEETILLLKRAKEKLELASQIVDPPQGTEESRFAETVTGDIETLLNRLGSQGPKTRA
jgi:hypothetical protein